MLIQVDKEGRETVQNLCDIALKVGGIQNLRSVNIILSQIKMIEPEKKEQDAPNQVKVPNKIKNKEKK